MDERSSPDDASATRGSLVDSRRLLFENIVTNQANRPEAVDKAAAAGINRRNGRRPKSLCVNKGNSFRDELVVPSTRDDVRTTTANDDSTERTTAVRRHSHNDDDEFRVTENQRCARDDRTSPVPSAAASASAAQSPSSLPPTLAFSQTVAPSVAVSQSFREAAASPVPHNECHSSAGQFLSSEDVSPVPANSFADTFPPGYSKRISYNHAVLNGARLKLTKAFSRPNAVAETSLSSHQLLSNDEDDGDHLDNVELTDRPPVVRDCESPANVDVAATPTTSSLVDDSSASSNDCRASLNPSSRDSCESLAVANDKPAQVVSDNAILLADGEKPAETADRCKSTATTDSDESTRLDDDSDITTPSAIDGSSALPAANDKSVQPAANKPSKPAVKCKPVLPTVQTKPIRSLSPVAAPSTAAGDYPEELNPFSDDDDDENDKESRPLETSRVDVGNEHNSTNPFGSGSDDEDVDESKSIAVSTNPFWSGSEEEDEENSYSKTPIPLPRSVIKPIASLSPQPSPRPRSRVTTGYSSNEISPTSSCRKLSADSAELNFDRSSSSNNFTPRKKKPAPPPPPLQTSANSTSPNYEHILQNVKNEQTKMVETAKINLDDSKKTSVTELNENANKKVVSSWKHKKRPAPARPTPLRRSVKEMPLEDIKVELEDIEVRYEELVRQTAQLEEKIRVKTDLESAESTAVEEMVVQLFELVNEKNELFRRRSELVNMRKMHSLEVEQADIEYQIRCLMLRPESNKTDTDKANEEALVKRLVEVVEKRNEIIDLMDKDRLRETVEDESVTTQLVPITNRLEKKEYNYKEKKKKNKKDKNKEHDDSDKLHSPSKLIKQKFMTLRHTAKKLHPKLPD